MLYLHPSGTSKGLQKALRILSSTDSHMLIDVLNWPVVLTHVGSGRFWVMETGMENPKAGNAKQRS